MNEEYTAQGLSPIKRAIYELKTQWYAEVQRNCLDGIAYELSQGNHEAVWETICNGPDDGGYRRNRVYETGDKRIAYYLTHAECDKMRHHLEQYAIERGWDADKGKARVAGMTRQHRGRIAGVARVLRVNGRRAG